MVGGAVELKSESRPLSALTPSNELSKLMRQHADDVAAVPQHRDCARTLFDYANRVEQLEADLARLTRERDELIGEVAALREDDLYHAHERNKSLRAEVD